jgi:hypothetical protein
MKKVWSWFLSLLSACKPSAKAIAKDVVRAGLCALAVLFVNRTFAQTT